MGSNNSRLGSRPSRSRVNSSTNRSLLSSLICGGSTSRATNEMDDNPAESMVKSAEHCATHIHEVQNCRAESSLSNSTRTGSTGENNEIRAIAENCFEDGFRGVGTSSNNTCLSECRELISPHQVSADCGHVQSSRDSSTTSSSLFKEQSSDQVTVNVSSNANAVNGTDNSVQNGVLLPSSSNSQALGSSGSNGMPVENNVAQETVVNSSDSNASSVHVSSPPVAFNPFGNEPLQEAQPSGLGFLVSNRERGRTDGVLHVDVVSISSNILSNGNPDSFNRDARRNSRRLFWDAFSRRSSRRLIESPTIVFSMDDNEDIGSHDRWLLGFSGDIFDEGHGTDPGYLGSRFPYRERRRRHSRSEVWERLRGGLDDHSRRNAFCPSGLHPDGSCSCESLLLTEESTTRASISRIVMLAEALFEVLDEIHRQPASLSLSMVSSPAPASVVDSFPLKSHSKVDEANGSNDVKECYICLAEYEEGDKIRVLPCSHEYHMGCVDKWLKEIHGVCPLCRGDVREGSAECTVSSSEIPSV